MTSSITVANRFLDLAKIDRNPLTPMQLLKLVYIAHGWMLGIYSRPLIDEKVQAWQYGPVIPDLYAHVRKYRGATITDKINTSFFGGDRQLDADEQSIVDQVYEAYKGYSGPQLSRMTHADGTPWHLTYERGSFGKVIPVDLIEDHYKKLASN
jgi:uncharacterized phage-associated protein